MDNSPVRHYKKTRAAATCTTCSKDLDMDLRKFIECSTCEQPVCHQCTKLPAPLIESICTGALEGLDWSCNSCKAIKPTLRNMSRKLDEICSKTDMTEVKMTQFEKRLEQVADDIEEKVTTNLKEEIPKMIGEVENRMTDKITNVEDRLTQQLAESIKKIDKEIKNLKDESKKQKPLKIQEVEKKIQEHVKVAVAEATPMNTPSGSGSGKQPPALSPDSELEEKLEREKRRKNMIIFKLDEEEGEMRSKEDRITSDTNKIMNIATDILGIKNLQRDEITKCERLGEKIDDLPRPLLIHLTTEKRKESIFNKLYKLKGSSEKHVSFTHDLTKKEREYQKKLIVKAKEKTEASKGKMVYKVRGPPWKIIEIDPETNKATRVERDQERRY